MKIHLVAAIAASLATASTAFAVDLTSQNARVVNFDDVAAPLTFGSAYALRDEYAALGVTFDAIGNDGGAVLVGSAALGIDGYSPPNYLAFSAGSQLASGGDATGPATLTFRHPVSYVQFSLGVAVSSPVQIDIYDSHAVLIGGASADVGSQMVLVVASLPDIAAVVVSVTGDAFAIDNLSFVLDSTRIDFDDLNPGPDLFSNATALRDRYAARGVTFSGPGNDGGAILDDEHFTPFLPHSGSNFLAFFSTPTGTLSDGGHAVLPETLHFSPAVGHVEFQVGDDSGSTIKAEAFDAGDVSLGSTQVIGTPALQPVVLDARGISRVVISTDKTSAVTVIDDLSFLIDGKMIDFDDVDPGPVLYSDTVALRDRYAPLGIKFRGDSDKNGGAILSDVSAFPESGYSAPNFVAFAMGGTFSDGGHSKLPETLLFDPPIRHLQFRFGSYLSFTLTAEAFDATNALLGSAEIGTTTTALQTLNLFAPGTVRVQITANGSAGILDDLAFTQVDPCVHGLCDQGDNLDATCDACATKVCAFDPYCCTDVWDGQCIGEAVSICGACPPPPCTHDLCSAGLALVADCDSCVADVCAVDATCCTSGWTTGCMLKTVTACPNGCDVCGDVNHDGKIVSSDALIVLKAAVSHTPCVLARCDFNGDTNITASDALGILKTAVGQLTNPKCPAV